MKRSMQPASGGLFKLFAVLLLAAVPDPAFSAGSTTGPALQARLDPIRQACRDAGSAAERDSDLPPGLLLAIGRQESGRLDEASGEFLPWPYAVNAAGDSKFFETKADAVRFVRNLLGSGVRSIDIGCFQINLQQHPDAFSSLDEGFDPDANARYAARFLMSLHLATGHWDATIGRYHSATAALAEPYMAAVLSRWEGSRVSVGSPAIRRDARVELIAGVIVQRPSSLGDRAVPLPAMTGLPRVISPTGEAMRVRARLLSGRS